MVSVCLTSDAHLQHLLSSLGFSYLGHRVTLHGCSSKAQLLFLILDKGYFLTVAPFDLQRGIAPLGPPAPAQPPLFRCVVGPPGRYPWPRAWGGSSLPPPRPQMRGTSSWPPPLTSDLGSSSRPFLRRRSLALSAAAPDLGHEVTPLGCHPSGMGSSQLLPLTSDLGWLLLAALSARGRSRPRLVVIAAMKLKDAYSLEGKLCPTQTAY